MLDWILVTSCRAAFIRGARDRPTLAARRDRTGRQAGGEAPVDLLDGGRASRQHGRMMRAAGRPSGDPQFLAGE
jgi:hypothetical protein